MTKEKKPSDYDIGYGKPPSSTQFKPGQSGNKSGRPKGSKSLDALIVQELGRRTLVTDRGRQRSMSKRQIMAVQTVNEAATGDHKARELVARVDRERESKTGGPQAVVEFWDTADDRLLFDRAMQRIRANEQSEPRPSEPATETRANDQRGNDNA